LMRFQKLYEYYLKLEQIIVPDPKAAEIKLRKKIASSMNVRE